MNQKKEARPAPGPASGLRSAYQGALYFTFQM